MASTVSASQYAGTIRSARRRKKRPIARRLEAVLGGAHERAVEQEAAR